MEKIEMTAILRNPGKAERNRLKREGFIPAIIYGPDMDNVLIAVKKHDLLLLLTHGITESKIINLSLENKSYQVLIKEIQKNPINEMPISVDFYRIEKAHPITVEIPIHIVGEAVGVKKGGVLEHHLDTIEIETLPSSIPEFIEIDVSSLDIGDHISVGDITPPKGVKILENKESILVSIVPPTVEREEAAPEAEEEKEEPKPKEKEE